MEQYFERLFKGPAFTDNEDKKYEFIRLESFQHWPIECPIFALKLAKAGFYYTGKRDEVKCFSCGVVKSGWLAGEDPFEVHCLLNPDCEFINDVRSNEVQSLNVPISNRSEEESPLIQRLNSVIEGRTQTSAGNDAIQDDNYSSNSQSRTRTEEDDLRIVGEDSELEDAFSSRLLHCPLEHQPAEHSDPESLDIDVPRSRSLGLFRDEKSDLSNVLIDSLNNNEPIFQETANRVTHNDATLQAAGGLPQSNSLNDLNSESKSNKKKVKKSSKNKLRHSKEKNTNSALTTLDSTRQRSKTEEEAARGLDIPPPTGASIGPLRFERNRLETFKNWPSSACVSPADLAKSGFHYTGSGDRVQCIFCKGVLRNWEQGDIPHVEHRKHFPRCPLMLGLKMGNVPLPVVPNLATSATTLGGSANQTTFNVADSLNSGNIEHLGIVTDRPKHPQYAIEAQRLATFQRWPPSKHQTPAQLAEAGFYYAGFNDNVKCFFCDGGLRNWEPGDKPWKEHARWFPKCPFVSQVKGQEFIKQVLQETGGEIPALAHIEELHTTNQSGFANGHLQEQPKVEEREIRARMDSPFIQKIIKTGIDREIIMNTIRKRLLETGDDFPSSTALMEAIFKQQMEDARRHTQNARVSQNAPQLPSQDTTISPPSSQNAAASTHQGPQSQNTAASQNAAQNSENHSPQLDILSSHSVLQNSTSAQTGPGELNSDENTQVLNADQTTADHACLKVNDTSVLADRQLKDKMSVQAEDLMKENIELKEQRLCKICMVDDANVVFLPCGHLVSCASCSPALQQCPICRASIKGTIRTYIA